jgi:hypothetical protein
MASISSISIPEPCQQQWQNMTPISGGRHCESCCKTVIDFTGMSNHQIIDLIAGGSKTCGRFTPSQLSGINYTLGVQQQHLSGWWKRVAIAAAVLWSVPFFNSTTLGEPRVMHQPMKSNDQNKPTPVTDSITNVTIRGKITDSNDNLPLPGVTVQLKGTGLEAVTNVNGEFSLTIPRKEGELVISFIGYNQQSVAINSANEQSYNLALKMQTAMLGEVVIIRHSFFKRAYYRFVRGPQYRVHKKVKKLFANI